MTNLEIATTDSPKSNIPKLGGRVRRLRRQEGMSQAALAIELGISASYLNLIEHNRRNLTVPLLIKLAERFDLELSEIAESDEGRLSADLMEAFGDELFGDIDLTNTDIRDLVTSNSTVARAILVLSMTATGICGMTHRSLARQTAIMVTKPRPAIACPANRFPIFCRPGRTTFLNSRKPPNASITTPRSQERTHCAP